MKAFVTGGTGFIGKRVVKRLVERGYDVTCIVRRPENAADLHDLGVTLVQGDVTDRETMREGMAGADVVFHIAGWYEVGIPPAAVEVMERINVGGTENALGLAVELGIPKIVYTSTTAVLGDTYGVVVDEEYQRDSRFDSVYDRTKYQAHQLAAGYIAEGAPVIIVMPSGVYGPGDHSAVGTFVRLLLRRLVPVLPGADTGWSFGYVDDVAEGHVLAAEKGRAGQTFVLGGDEITLGEVLRVTARLAGVPAPVLFVKSDWVTPLTPLAAFMERTVTLPWLFSSEVIKSQGRTWWATSAKAEQELGYTHRSIEEGLAETVLWEAAQLRERSAILELRAVLALAAVFCVGIFVFRRRRKQA